MITASSPKTAIQAWAYSQALTDFNGDKTKATWASMSIGHCVDYSKNMPIGWLPTNTQEEFQERLTNHVTAQMKADPNVKPVGFFMTITFGWLFLQILGGAISWAVQHFLKLHYPEEK